MFSELLFTNILFFSFMSALPVNLESCLPDPLLREHLWRGDALTGTHRAIASGHTLLDRELPGSGWPTHCLTELLLPAAGIGELRLLSPALQQLDQVRRQILLLVPESDEFSMVSATGLQQLGLDPAHVTVIRAKRPADRLWAIEQSLRNAAFGALLAWLPAIRNESLRRLQLAAANAGGLCFLIRPLAAQHEASPAPLRLSVQPAPAVAEGQRLSVQLLKRRGPVLAKPVVLTLPQARPLRIRPTASTAPMTRVRPLSLSGHAVARPAFPQAALGSHPAPAA